MSTIRAFISYAWTDAEHQQWVVDLATRLRTDGIDIVLDVWDLEAGHDKYHFMERMVSDPSIGYVLVICNAKYAEKANTRAGGVGDETQIISPEIYSNTKNKKFIPVLAEVDDDGKSLVPSYLKTRIYIDISSEQAYFDGYDKLLRLLHGAPEFPKPALGKKPDFLKDSAPAAGSTTMPLLRRAIVALEQDKRMAVALAQDHLEAVAATIRGLRVIGDGQPIDDKVLDSIRRGKTMRDEVLELLEALCRTAASDQAVRLIHRLFEDLLDGCYHQGGSQWQEAEYDPIRFTTTELFLYVVTLLLTVDELDVLRAFLEEVYVHRGHYGGQTTSHYDAFYFDVESIERVRNRRLNLQRTSPIADLIKERADRERTPFEQLQQADFLLFLRSRFLGNLGWYPRTLVYLGHHSSAFPVFLGLESPRRAKRLEALLGTGSAKELRAKFESSFQEPSSRSLRLGNSAWPMSIAGLMNLERERS